MCSVRVGQLVHLGTVVRVTHLLQHLHLHGLALDVVLEVDELVGSCPLDSLFLISAWIFLEWSMPAI